MSSQVAQFHQQVLQDRALVEQLKTAGNFQGFVHLTVKLGKEHGYSFTQREVETYVRRNMLTLIRQFS
ncbi:Nif11-like leader peptide family natural product precursor [Pseudanabaenaceae cyanobacterium LEGE 13415]|nr:Nif11-like leader peptide family natural product precursor [Pseudanabaenaceae cyanobacterium LEGE 13415]